MAFENGISGYVISIHALVKRATEVHSLSTAMKTISIHALVKRATMNVATQSARRFGISIHALVKRATGYHWDWAEKKLFQSTPS